MCQQQVKCTSGLVNCLCLMHGQPLRYSQGKYLSVCLFVGCLTSQQQASVSQGRICSNNFRCCHTEIEAADQQGEQGGRISVKEKKKEKKKKKKKKSKKIKKMKKDVCLLVGCLTSQQHASVSQGPICTILRAATLR